MRPKNDARAFPFESQTCAAKELGLTKREWFAGMAMQGLLSNSNIEWQNPEVLIGDVFEVVNALEERFEKDKRREDCDLAVGRPAEALE